jgi:diguanylate cyclase (GGDEF)-like protein/PAS domain S-box-containing protein
VTRGGRTGAESLAQLKRELHHYRELAENTSDWLWEVDATGTYVWASPRVRGLLGYEVEEVLGKTPFDFMTPAEAKRVRALFDRIVEDRRSFNGLVSSSLHKDGREVVLESSGVPIFDERGLFRGYRGVDRDITSRIRAERHLRLADAVVRSAAEGIVLADMEGRVTTANPAFLSMTGHALEEVVGRPPSMLVRPDGDFRQHLWSGLDSSKSWSGEGTCRHKTGKTFPVWMTLSGVKDSEANHVSGFVALVSDMTERRAAEATIRFQATHDMLTQLANRAAFLSALKEVVQAGALAPAAVLFIDLDGFKPVNDVHGHGVGDELLCAVARRLERCVRQTDLVARFGGDEFIVLIRQPAGPHAPKRVAQSIVKAVAEPYRIEGLEVRVSASVGVALVPAHGRTADEVVAAADRAMYAAKRAGGNCVRFARARRGAAG